MVMGINRNGLRWCDPPKEFDLPKTIYNRWKRWSDKGVFVRMMDGLAAEVAIPSTALSDATYLKAHRTETSLRSKKGGPATRGAVCSAGQRVARTPSCMPSPMPMAVLSGSS